MREEGEVLYLYLDESGNFDFSDRGSEYFIMTCVAMRRPFKCARALLSYKYDCMEHGMVAEKFHACEDTDQVRSDVLDRIVATCGEYAVFAALVSKNSLPDHRKSADYVYSIVFGWVISEVFDSVGNEGFQKVIVVTDSIPKEARRKQVEKPLKAYMKQRFQRIGITYELLHHKSESDLNLQVADYLCWAVQRKVARGKDWPFSKVKQLIKDVGQVVVVE